MNPLAALMKYGGQPLTTQILLGVLRGYKRPFDKIGEWVEKGILMQLRRGLYAPTGMSGISSPEPFLIANHLYGPSHISIDSALAHWGLIPEYVFEISSVTNRMAKTVVAGGRTYSYTHLPMPYYAFGIRQVQLTGTQTVLMAGPEKSICDKIITTAGLQLRSRKQAMEFLEEDLRIDRESLRNLDSGEMSEWLVDCPKVNSISNMIEAIKMI